MIIYVKTLASGPELKLLYVGLVSRIPLLKGVSEHLNVRQRNCIFGFYIHCPDFRFGVFSSFSVDQDD